MIFYEHQNNQISSPFGRKKRTLTFFGKNREAGSSIDLKCFTFLWIKFEKKKWRRFKEKRVGNMFTKAEYCLVAGF